MMIIAVVVDDELDVAAVVVDGADCDDKELSIDDDTNVTVTPGNPAVLSELLIDCIVAALLRLAINGAAAVVVLPAVYVTDVLAKR